MTPNTFLLACLEGAGGGTPPSDLDGGCTEPPRPLSHDDPPSSRLDSGTPPLETSDDDDGGHIVAPRYGAIDHYDFAPVDRGESVFRHGFWRRRRGRVYRALLRTGASCRRVQNFADCGSTLWAVRDGQEISLVCNKCHDRMCEACQRERQSAVVEGVLLRCHDAGLKLRFATLTIKHSDAPLAVQIYRLVSSFKLLRKHPAVGKNMVGGVWFLEVKLDKGAHRWHPHLHVIIEGDFIGQKLLSQAWHQVTGDSYIVDIREVGEATDRARYVTKYATKPLHAQVSLFPAKLDEFLTAIKGKRLYQCFGSWMGAVTREKRGPHKGVMLGRVDTLWRAALGGDADALGVMRVLHGRFPKLRTAYALPNTIHDSEPDLP